MISESTGTKAPGRQPSGWATPGKAGLFFLQSLGIGVLAGDLEMLLQPSPN